MRMTVRSLLAPLLALAVLLPHAAVAQTAPVAPSLALAREGRAVEAWELWNRLPAGESRSRLGIQMSAVLGDMVRGIQIYEELRALTGSQEVEAIRLLALSVAAAVPASIDAQTDGVLIVFACSAALRIDAAHAPCIKVLEGLATDGPAGSRAIALYALADAGRRPFPALFKTYEASMTPQTRLLLAQRFTRLSAIERLALVQPLLTSQDVGVQYQTLLALGTIDHPGAALALSTFEPTMSPLRAARLVALAQRGDDASLEQVAAMVGGLDNTLKVPAGLALVRAGNPRGAVALNEVMASAVDIDRVRAAEAVASVNTESAQPVIIDALTTGSPVLRPIALQAAGVARLGTRREVYSKLASSDPQERALAVVAIADTGLSPAAETSPGPSPLP
jgi:HEAT repeat protein